MATSQVNTSRVITNITALIHNRKVAEYIKHELKADLGSKDLRDLKFPDIKSKAKALATALIIKRKDAPIIATQKIIIFNTLINPYWENLAMMPEEIKIRTNSMPYIELHFREKTGNNWGRSSPRHKLYFPDDSVISQLKHGRFPKLPIYKQGRIMQIVENKIGGTFKLYCETTRECEKWVKNFGSLIDPKYKPLTASPSVQLSDKTISKKNLHLKYVKYYPHGREGQALYTGYPA